MPFEIRMRKYFVILIVTLFPVVGSAQTEVVQDMEALRVPYLGGRVSADIDITRLDCARRVFPNVMYDDNSLTRSVPIRRFGGRRAGSLLINRMMRIMGVSEYWFDDAGELRLAMMFHLEAAYGREEDLDVLAIYKLKAKFVLIDVVDARLPVWKDDDAKLAGGFTELAVGSGHDARGTIHLINTRRASSRETLEKHRFLLLEKGKLREVADLPVLTNSKDCGGEITHLVYFDRPRFTGSQSSTPLLTVERQINPMPGCRNRNTSPFIQYETHRLEWEPSTAQFRRRLVNRKVVGILRSARSS